MSIQTKKEIIDYFVQDLGWARNQVEDLGFQCQWNKNKMLEIYKNFYPSDQNLGGLNSQNQFALSEQEVINQFGNDDQDQLQQALIASQCLQDNTPIIDRKKYDDYPVGIQNLGNTCYFNCLLQIIFYNPNLVQQILQYKIAETNQTQENLKQLSDNFMTQFQYVIAKQMLWNQKYLKPSEFYEATTKFEMIKPNYKVVSIQEYRDLSEYLTSFMELIDQCLSKNFNKLNDQINIFYSEELEKQYIIKQEKQHQLQFHVGIQHKQIYHFLYKEIIENKNYIKELPHNLIFVISRTDNFNKKIEDDFYFPQDLYLDFVLGNQQAIQHVQNYINQQLNTQNLYQQLKKQADAFERVVNYYESLPTFDTFILNSLKLEQKLKIQEMKQQFPSNYHLLNQELQQGSKNLYKLAQIVAHKGSISQGHYYLYQYNFHLKKWFKYNDSTVLMQTEQEIIADSLKQGNILIYISQEQKKKVEYYQKQLHEIDIIRKSRGLELLNHNNIQYDFLQKIPIKICKEVIASNEKFLDQYKEAIKIK
ncbi:unnamed protein product [Paramecium primaurelia]|uniref:ubiquitinyl hydrolase 1 n=1 Tax=Paramecium primaurelia TaxID=5886 RepID=A0A8S1P5B8_PARPR|nr:unnamed protein product [Paramecium primaurelia]